MKYILRPLSILMALLMISGLAACGKEEPSSSAGTASGNTSSDVDMADVEIWDGTVAQSVARGTGTEETPFVILTAAELAYAVTDGGDDGYYYQLANDIYLNDVSDTYWMLEEDNNQWVSSGDFNGTIDGNGFCIYGIWMSNADRPDDGGLVTDLVGGGFKNLGIRYSHIVAKNYAGAFAGRVSGGLSFFENCFADDTVYVQYTDMGRNGAGGIIGYASAGGTTESKLDFLNCYSKANVLGLGVVERVNGIIGTSWNCAYTMKNCYSYGLPPYCGKNANTASYLLSYGWKTEDVYENIYTDKREQNALESFTLLSSSDMEEGMSLDYDTAFTKGDGSTPKLKVFAAIDGKMAAEYAEMTYLRHLVVEFSGGSGSESDPFIVTTPDQLRYVIWGYWENTYFKMIQDIHINETTRPGWTSGAVKWEQSSSNSFGGNFDGNGYSVYGLYYNDTPGDELTDTGLGLFTKISPSAVIKNVHIKDSVLNGKGNVGGVVGGMSNYDSDPAQYAQITGCSVDDSVVLKGYTAGGILGHTKGGVNITGCTYDCEMSSKAQSGGAIGLSESNNYKVSN